ncbi:hypothetical protein [Streptomyces sp. NPDC017086]|uniref:hypothetical protein n=1 Tax=Streptomyces sp. NPDC017086 TaxID=3364976 RepID=UPI0037B1C349
MTVRLDVEELLRAGYGDRTIARQVGVTISSVTRARALLRLPKARSGYKPAATAEDLFWRRARPTGDGHYEWTGSFNGSTPFLKFGGRANGRNLTAYRIAYRIKHGIEPSGTVRPVCGRRGCVAPDHVDVSMTAPASGLRVGRPPGCSREDIEALLQAGGTNTGIARQLHTNTRRVAAIRAELGLAQARKTHTFAERWAAATEPATDGHLRWTGRLGEWGTPRMVYHGRDCSARRAAFEELHGRPAVGPVFPGCGWDECVRPEHLEDSPMRATLRNQLTAIFGAAA